MKYLIKIDYACDNVKTGGLWLIIEGNNEPFKGIIDKTPFKRGLLPNHDCKRYYNSQLCEEDPSCFWQEILEVKPFSEESARTLKARYSEKIQY